MVVVSCCCCCFMSRGWTHMKISSELECKLKTFVQRSWARVRKIINHSLSVYMYVELISFTSFCSLKKCFIVSHSLSSSHRETEWKLWSKPEKYSRLCVKGWVDQPEKSWSLRQTNFEMTLNIIRIVSILGPIKNATQWEITFPSSSNCLLSQVKRK